MKPFEILFRLFAPPRRARRAAPVSRPRIEALEDRVVPATILWTGAAGDNLWGSSGNWNLGRLPGTGDDVVIDVAGDQAVVYSGGTTNIRSLVSRESLRMAGGKLTATDSLKVTGADLDFVGGSFGSAVTLTNVDLRLGSTGAATFIFLREQNTLSGNPLSGQSLIVRADAATPAEASAKLTAPSALINSGLIRLDSGATAGGSASLVLAAGVLTNSSVGQIELGGKGSCTLGTDVRNNGFLSVQTDATIGKGGNGSQNFNTGFLQVLNDAALTWQQAGAINDVRGIISGKGSLAVVGSAVVNRGIIDLVRSDRPNDPDSPTILDLRRHASALTITFFAHGGMNEATVERAASYVIRTSGGDGTFSDGNEGTLTPAGVVYDPATSRVILTFSRPLPRDSLQVRIQSSEIKDNNGNALLTQTAPSDYVFFFPGAFPSKVGLDLKADSDTGTSSSDNLTMRRRLEFSVSVNGPGVFTLDVNGDGRADISRRVAASGVYTVRLGPLGDGTHTILARFTPTQGDPDETDLDVTIDRTGPRLRLTPTTLRPGFTTVPVRFTEAIDPASFTPADVVLRGPNGAVVPIAAVSGSGTDYELQFAAASPAGTYRLRIGPDIRDLAGNVMDQDRDGVGGEGFQDIGFKDIFTNRAPVLDPTGTVRLPTVRSGAGGNRGLTVAELLASAGDPITDGDVGAREGIAVVGVDNTNGAWQYSIDGGATWRVFGTPGESSARLLAAHARSRIRFLPKRAFVGTVTDGLTFRAWDRTVGVNGGVMAINATGDATAFSTETETVVVQVTA